MYNVILPAEIVVKADTTKNNAMYYLSNFRKSIAIPVLLIILLVGKRHTFALDSYLDSWIHLE